MAKESNENRYFFARNGNRFHRIRWRGPRQRAIASRSHDSLSCPQSNRQCKNPTPQGYGNPTGRKPKNFRGRLDGGVVLLSRVYEELFGDFSRRITLYDVGSEGTKWLAWLVAPYLGMTRKLVSRSVNVSHEMDKSKSIHHLKMGEYRPLTATIREMYQQCIEAGFIPNPGVPESVK